MQSVATFRAIGHRPIVGTACAPVLLRVAPSSRRFVGRNAVDRHLRSAEKETQRMSNEPSTGKQMMETADDMRRAGTIPLFPGGIGTFIFLIKTLLTRGLAYRNLCLIAALKIPEIAYRIHQVPIPQEQIMVFYNVSPSRNQAGLHGSKLDHATSFQGP